MGQITQPSTTPELIFFGNGPLAEAALTVLKPHVNLLFHARTKTDLTEVATLKSAHPDAFGVLASFGVLIKSDLLELFEPEGILNIHPSKLPLYRGPSPIESAILAGDTDFSVSVMKLVKAMDAGPVYYQQTFSSLPLDKASIYQTLASSAAAWLCDNFANLVALRSLSAASTPSLRDLHALFPMYANQDDTQATFTQKLDKSQAYLTPQTDSAAATLRKIVAFQTFPKPKYTFFGQEVIILSAHLAPADYVPADYNPVAQNSSAKKIAVNANSAIADLAIKCADNRFVVVDRLQPLSRKPMDARAFLNGLRSH